MKKLEKVVIVGLGALGCAYASKLYDLNPQNLRIIAGGERANRYKSAGFLINGKHYNFNYIAPEEKSEPADLLLVTVKANQLAQAIFDMKNQVGDNTIILSLLNGITSEEAIGREYGMEKLLYSVSYGLTANREGNQIKFPSYGNIAFGEKVNTEYSARVQVVQELFERAGIPYSIPEDMLRASGGSLWLMWELISARQ